MAVKAKKHLGQHFLTDKNICQKIAAQYRNHNGCNKVIEIGPDRYEPTLADIEEFFDNVELGILVFREGIRSYIVKNHDDFASLTAQ
jgi:hypothetical protein